MRSVDPTSGSSLSDRGSSRAFAAACVDAARETLPGVSVQYIWHSAKAPAQDFRSYLTREDFAEYADIRHGETRDRCLRTRARLRAALSAAVDQDVRPQDWGFYRGPFGQPLLRRSHGLNFSCSHTPVMSAIAVSRHLPVGIDVAIGGSVDVALLDSEVTPREAAALRSPGPDAATRLWTLKEAVAKAIGTGFALPFAQIEFEIEDGSPTIGKTLDLLVPGLQLTSWSVPQPGPPLIVSMAVAPNGLGGTTREVFPSSTHAHARRLTSASSAAPHPAAAQRGAWILRGASCTAA